MQGSFRWQWINQFGWSSVSKSTWSWRSRLGPHCERPEKSLKLIPLVSLKNGCTGLSTVEWGKKQYFNLYFLKKKVFVYIILAWILTSSFQLNVSHMLYVVLHVAQEKTGRLTKVCLLLLLEYSSILLFIFIGRLYYFK